MYAYDLYHDLFPYFHHKMGFVTLIDVRSNTLKNEYNSLPFVKDKPCLCSHYWLNNGDQLLCLFHV